MKLPMLTHEFADKFEQLSMPWKTTGVNELEIVWLNVTLAKELGLNVETLKTPAGTRWLVGLESSQEVKTVAQVYAGHQFGYFSPRLGDGRALLLGELQNKEGKTFDLHLKGSGPTPFSRGGDGYAALGPMLREAAMGEAMNALDIPTSRALAVVKTGRWLHRDGEIKPAAILIRVAASHIRVGTFEYLARRGNIGDVRALSEYVRVRHFSNTLNSQELLEEVVQRQAKLVAKWNLVGFVHGVMNTDNMAISGETLDYGPCAFIDSLARQTVFSSIDHGGRYAYERQSAAAKWNLARFAETTLTLIDENPEKAAQIARETVEKFDDYYSAEFNSGFASKIGLPNLPAFNPELLKKIETEIFDDMREQDLDFTVFFVTLMEAVRERDLAGARSCVRDLNGGYTPGEWFDEWWALNPDESVMRKRDPLRILRNELLAERLDLAEQGDMAPFTQLVAAVSDPHEVKPEWLKYDASPTSGHFITTCGT